jgi:hypothetical protein
VGEVNKGTNLDNLAQDPYGDGWLFQIAPYIPGSTRGVFQRVNYQQEFEHLLGAEQYRALLAKSVGGGTVSVESITCATQGGRKRDRNLLITTALVDQVGKPVAGASVRAQLDFDGGYVEFAGVTGEDGQWTCVHENAPSATYTTRIEEISADGRAWGDRYATPKNKYRK